MRRSIADGRLKRGPVREGSEFDFRSVSYRLNQGGKSDQELVFFLRDFSNDSRGSLLGVLFVRGQLIQRDRAQWIPQ